MINSLLKKDKECHPCEFENPLMGNLLPENLKPRVEKKLLFDKQDGFRKMLF